MVAAWISYLKGTTENSIFPLHSCIIFTFSDLFHSPAIKLFHVKLVKTGLDGKRAEFLFSLLNTQKLITKLRNFSGWNKRYFLVKVFIKKFVNFLVFRQRWNKTRWPRINCPNSSITEACFWVKLPFKEKSPTLPQYWEVMVEVWPGRREEGQTEGEKVRGEGAERTDDGDADTPETCQILKATGK